MKPARSTVAALILVGLLVGSTGAGYMIGQSAFRHSTSFQTPAPPFPVPVSPATPTTPSTASAPAPGDHPPGGHEGEAAASAPGTGPSPSAAEPASVRPEAPAGTSAGTPVAPGASPPPRPTSTPSVPQLPSRFHVQIGAFTDSQNAEALALRVKSLGYAVTVVGGPPFRVWVGGYLDRATADRLAQHLSAAGFDAALTPR